MKAEIDVLRSRTGLPNDGAAPMTSSVAKVIQPTATVSSVPVCGPSMSECLKIYKNLQIKQNLENNFIL